MRMTVSREHTLSERGVGKPGFPSPRPREGLSGRHPLRTTFMVPLRMRAGGPRTQALAPLPVKETGRATPSRNPLFVIVSYDRSYAVASIVRVRSNVNIRSRRGAWGNPVSPCPHPREGLGGRSPPRNSRMFIGQGLALTQGDGKTRFPHPLTGWEGKAFPKTTLCSLWWCAAEPYGRLIWWAVRRVRLIGPLTRPTGA